MSDAIFFGYGSLVNRATHQNLGITRARVKGWRRVWKRTRFREMAFLSVAPAEGAEIAGLIAEVPDGDWTALDLRETGYGRGAVTAQTDAGARAVQMYQVNMPEIDADRPILLSYLDVVLQGYLREFGDAGVSDFIATTDGWDTTILNDRAQPLYPRAQVLSADETAMVDGHLAALGCRIID